MSVQRGRKELSLGNDVFDIHETTVFEGRNWPLDLASCELTDLPQKGQVLQALEET